MLAIASAAHEPDHKHQHTLQEGVSRHAEFQK